MGQITAVKKYWEVIADNLSKAGWSWGCVSAIDSNGRTIWIADADRLDGQRFIVRADEKLTAYTLGEIYDLAIFPHPFNNFGAATVCIHSGC
jgi:hypothetical protein